MPARVARRVRIDPEQFAEPYLEPGLLARLADRRVLHCLANVDEAARQRVSERRVPAPDEHDRPARAVFELDHEVDDDLRGARARHQAPPGAGRPR